MLKSKNKNEMTEKEAVNQAETQDGNNNTVNGNNGACDNTAECADNTCDNTAGMTGGQEQAAENNNDDVSVWKDKYMRLSAEFDNYRKRTLKEKMDLVSYGGEDVIKALLPVLDDMDRAIDNMRKTEDIDSVRTGIELITQKLCDMIKQKEVSEIEAVGCELDTDLHEAVAKVPVQDEAQKGKIIDVVQKGYKLKDKVVRHCKVVVGE